MAAILFDLGGTHMRCAVAPECPPHSKLTLTRIEKRAIPNFLNSGSAKDIWTGVLQMITDYVDSVADIAGAEFPIVLAFPGPVDAQGRILAAPTISGERPAVTNLGSEVSRVTGRRTSVLNDMSAAAWLFSSTSAAKRFIIVTISSGIGSKVFDRGSELGVIDDVPYAGEIGHVVVDSSPDAPKCDCGGRGHLGAIASGRGIERAARHHAELDPARFADSFAASKLGATATTLRNETHLVPAALAGDRWALEVIRRNTQPLGKCLALVTAALGLDQIAIMGGFAQSLGPVYIQLLQETMMDQSSFKGFPKFDSNFIHMCSTGEEVCLWGTATYAQKRWEQV